MTRSAKKTPAAKAKNLRRKKSLIRADGTVRNLTMADIKKFKPIADVPALQPFLQAIKKGGRPRIAKPRVAKTFRLPADLVAQIEAYGEGYTRKVEAALAAAFME